MLSYATSVVLLTCTIQKQTNLAVSLQAASIAKAEQSAELAEFDENIPWDEREAELKETREQEMSRLEHELAMLDKEVSLILMPG